MSCIHKAEPHPLRNLKLFPVLTGNQMLEGLFRIGNGIEGLHEGLTCPLALLILPLGIALLNVGGIPQHDGQELSSQLGTVDISGKSLLYQQRNAS